MSWNFALIVIPLLRNCPTIIDSKQTTEDEVFTILSQLDSTKATGPDGITNKLLKEAASAIKSRLLFKTNDPFHLHYANYSINHLVLPYSPSLGKPVTWSIYIKRTTRVFAKTTALYHFWAAFPRSSKKLYITTSMRSYLRTDWSHLTSLDFN